MRALIRAVLEGFLGVATVAVVAVLHIALRSALQYHNRKRPSMEPPEDGSIFSKSEQLRRPVFLSRADEL
ncbi:MAG TPA: hypothetical protein VHT24_06205 [Pseudacidobacterium sp.]|nr:hypothetical protein [Pseudacidobacterium sp.]